MDPYQQQNQNTPLKSNDFQAINIQNPGQVGVALNVGGQFTGMVNPQLPGEGSNRQASGDYFSIRHENMGFHIPAICHDLCFKKLFPRKLPRHSASFVCQNCGQQTNSVCKTEIGCGLLICTLVAICCNPCCFWVPASLDDCYDVTHICSNCRKRLGEEKFLLDLMPPPTPPNQTQTQAQAQTLGSPQRP